MLWPTAILDLRLLELVMRNRRVDHVAAQFLPWTWTGFAVMVSTGVILFWVEAVKCYNSPFFPIKLFLILLAGLNALIFHRTVFRHREVWDTGHGTPFRAKLAGGMSLVVWIGVVAMGRALAYA